MFMCFLLLGLWFIIKTKVIVQKLDCEKIFQIELNDQTLTGKYKGLTVEAEMKYLLTNWFSGGTIFVFINQQEVW